jgi:DnaJ-class molecular chaperone
MATLYDTLGVCEDASEDEIKRAYRKAAMKWHPDRNVGREDAARAAFQKIKDAYAVLCDSEQRKVYDAVFAEEMRRWQHHRQQAEQERAERESAAQAAYTEMVTLAMRFADNGYNRDVVFGVLLGHQCEATLANRIADSVAALHESRQAHAAAGPAAQESETPSAHRDAARDQSESHGRRHTGVFDTLWHSFFGIRS